MKRVTGVSILLILAVILAACTTATPTAAPTTSGGGTGATGGTPVTASVSMSQIKFVPETLTVAVGTTVTWTNEDTVQHNVTADDGTFDSGPIAPGGTFSFTFTTAGTYAYKCTIHQPDMVGTIIVTP